MTLFDLLKSPTYSQKPILEKIVCHVLGLTKTQLFIHTEQLITDDQKQQIDTMYRRYVDNKEPLEYILGYVEFAKLQVHVSPATIIPRPETEYMLEAVREYFDEPNNPRPVTLIDVGTGSGILWVCTMYYQSDRISLAYLTELSTDALEVAKKNKETHLNSSQQEKTTLLHCSLLDHPTIKQIFDPKWQKQSILLVANLPYIPDEMFANNADERITKREPTMAFIGWDDGLDLYRIMFDQIIDYNVTAKLPITMYLEMMTWQLAILEKEYIEHFTFGEVKTFHANIRILKVISI
jgi:release factor glutamine methyltransferase